MYRLEGRALVFLPMWLKQLSLSSYLLRGLCSCASGFLFHLSTKECRDVCVRFVLDQTPTNLLLYAVFSTSVLWRSTSIANFLISPCGRFRHSRSVKFLASQFSCSAGKFHRSSDSRCLKTVLLTSTCASNLALLSNYLSCLPLSLCLAAGPVSVTHHLARDYLRICSFSFFPCRFFCSFGWRCRLQNETCP